MRDENIKELERLLRRFVACEDRSPEYVGAIGDFLSDRFTPGVDLPTDLYEQLEITTACYRPGGGAFMYDEMQAAAVFMVVLERLGIKAS